LSEIDGKNSKKNKVDLESSDLIQVRKMIEAETVFSQKARGVADRETENNALSILALAYSRLGQTSKAIQCFQVHLYILQEFGNFEEVCGLLAILGDAYSVSGDIYLAKNYYVEQRVLAESKGLNVYVGSSCNRIGFVFIKQGKLKRPSISTLWLLIATVN
jgi:hypothetical protein